MGEVVRHRRKKQIDPALAEIYQLRAGRNKQLEDALGIDASEAKPVADCFRVEFGVKLKKLLSR